ncbi:MAG: DUF5320 domain-containing protein [Deltaproteobacteria bacterium]|nr:DUF5320 domain-containing protein [Deltaproteobacteria bacterium]
MPAFDGTGPLGRGPMTGWGMGYCNPGGPMQAPYPAYSAWAPGYMAPGYGRGLGRGRGRGFGRGRGLGWAFCRWAGRGLGWGRGYGRRAGAFMAPPWF